MKNYFTPPGMFTSTGTTVLPACLIFFLCFLLLPAAQAQMQGSYTIGHSGADFASFGAAAEALETEGISGPVTFNVQPGTYEEQLSIGAFAGNSCEHPVIFEGDSTEIHQTVLRSPSPDSPFTLEVNGADGITFRNMSIAGGETVLQIADGTDCFSLEGNTLRGGSGAIVQASSGTDGMRSNQHGYVNNTFIGGTIAILKDNTDPSMPNEAQMDQGLIIDNNIFRDQQESAIVFNGQRNFRVDNNRVNISSGSGISSNNSWYGQSISGNIVEIADAGSAISLNSVGAERVSENQVTVQEGGSGLSLSAGQTAQNEILLANNRIAVYGYEDTYTSVGSMYGLSVSGGNGSIVKIYHNAVRVAGYTEDGRSTAFSAGGTDNSLYIYNNSIADAAWGRAVSISNPSAVAAMDYNNIYKGETQPLFGSWNGQNIDTFEEWQNTTGLDEHSLSVNPDEEQGHELFAGAGIFVEEVTTDLYGRTRNNPPSIGALEMDGEPYQLSGTYTIGGNDADFDSFTAAIEALDRQGVVDSILFLVRPGTYREQLTIRDIDGPVTFRGESGDSTDVVLEYPAGYTIHLIESEQISFQYLTISGTGNVVHFSGSSNILFENNILRSNGGEGSWEAVVRFNLVNQSPRVYTANTNNTFRQNRIIGEYQGMEGRDSYYDERGGYTIGDSNLLIEGNIIETGGTALNFSAQSGLNIVDNTIYVNSADAISLSGNESIDAVNGNQIIVRGSGTAIRISGLGGNSPNEIMNNRILLPDGGTGIHFYYGTSGGSTIANNMISVNSNEGSNGILLHEGNGLNFYFNSVLLYGDDTNSKVLNFADEMAGDIQLQNNIFFNAAGGYVLYSERMPYADQYINFSDYNNFHTSGDVLALWHNEDVPTLEDWQALTAYDENSLSQDPQFESIENLIPANPAMFNAGISLPSVNTDFYGNFRQTPPDLGAVENESVPLTPLAGTYTIGGENPDFANFNAALDAMELVGITDSVTFYVRPGIYEEPLELSAISGSSCDVPVVFEGDRSDSTAVVLNTGPYGIRMEGVSGVTFRYMEIERVNMQGGNNCITFEHNHIRGQLRAVPDYGGAANNYHTYRNNNIGSGIEKRRGGNFNPDDPDFEEGLEITGNIVTSVSFYTSIGIELEAQKDFIINHNTINVQVVDWDDAGISLTNSWYGKEIRGNTISISSVNGYGYGIRTEMGFPERVSENNIIMEPSEPVKYPYSDEPQEGLGGGTGILVSTGEAATSEFLIANNQITVQGHESQPITGTLAGIHIQETYSDQDIIKVYHNSVAISGHTEGNWGYDQGNALLSQAMTENSLYILNNILSASDEGYLLNIMHPSALAISDYNLLEGLDDPASGGMLRWGDQEVNSLEAWQTLTGMDMHSITSGPVAGAGIKVEEVDYDIEGRLRNDPPSIGAIEIEGDDPEVPVVLTPILECVVQNDDGSYTATFGYHNPGEESVELAVGAENFLDLMEYAGQPESFAPGHHERAFHVVFEASQSLSWTLGDTTLTVDRNSPVCEEAIIQPLVPLAGCVSELDRTLSLASMGYHNPNDAPVAIAAGRLNRMSGRQDQGQPTVFEPGLHEEAFAASYSGTLMWTLGRERAMVNRQTPACSPALQAVQPLLDCVSDNGDGTYTAHFGYHNPNAIAVSAGSMLHNQLLPAFPGIDERPLSFEPGRHERAFSVPFRGQRLEWRLMGNAVRADRSAALACGNAANARTASLTDEPMVEGSSMEVYPNPFSKTLQLKLPDTDSENISIRVYALSGVLLLEESKGGSNNDIRLELDQLDAGTYILEVQSAENSRRIRILKH